MPEIAGKVLVVPEETGVPFTNREKSETILVPPLSLMTLLMTVTVDGCDDPPGAGGGHAVGTVMVSFAVVIVPPKAKDLPSHSVLLPMVTPASLTIVPMNVVSAPSVAAALGVQNTSDAWQAGTPPTKVTSELSTVESAPVILKIYVPPPLKLIPPDPMEAAPPMQ